MVFGFGHEQERQSEALKEKDAHAGMAGVPPHVKEVPFREFDKTPLKEADTLGLVKPLPDVVDDELNPVFPDTQYSAPEVATLPEKVETTPKSRRGLFISMGAGAATLAVAAGAFFATQGGDNNVTPEPQPSNSAEPLPQESEAPQPVETQQPVEISERQQSIADYLATLAPEQAAVRDNLSSEKLAALSPDQIETIFQVNISEVSDANGQLDLNKYAVAVTTRLEAINNAGCSEAEFNKFGGLDGITSGDYVTISNNYALPATKGLFAREQAKDLTPAIARCSSTMFAASQGEAVDPYYVSYAIKDGSVEITDPNSVNFVINTSDNWNSDVSKKLMGSDFGGVQEGTTWVSLENMIVDESTGRIAPSNVTTNP